MAALDISDYLNNMPDIAKNDIYSFISFMKEEFPEITPKISFSMPMWWVGDKMYDGYVAISGAKKHFSIHFLDEQYLVELKTELPNCAFGKRCINIKYADEAAFSITKQKVKKYLQNIIKP